MIRPGAIVLGLLALLASGACGKRPAAPISPVTDPREAALVLLQAAQIGRTSRADLAGILGELPPERWAEIGDALRPLRGTTRARVVSAEEIGPERTAVDLEVALAGAGSATFRVQAERGAGGTWRVVSLDGPGVAWPSRTAPRDDGLSTSSPPRP